MCNVDHGAFTGSRALCAVIAGIVHGHLRFLLLTIWESSIVASVLSDLFFTIGICGAAVSAMARVEAVGTGGHVIFRTPEWDKRDMNPPASFPRRTLNHPGSPQGDSLLCGDFNGFIDLTCPNDANTFLIAVPVALILAGMLGVYAFSASRARRMFRSKRTMKNLNRGTRTAMIGAGMITATC